MDQDRWQHLMHALGFAPNADTYEKLFAAYSEPHRYYHGVSHVEACLTQLERSAVSAKQPEEIEIALWFHDAVYKPLAPNNERASADWAARFLTSNNAARAVCQRVHRLIMVTEHDAPTRTSDESLLVDIDLTILGAKPSIYDQFETNVRLEYRRVPAIIYRARRAAVLEGFLNRNRIYHNEPFQSDFESQARPNLARAIRRLRTRA